MKPHVFLFQGAWFSVYSSGIYRWFPGSHYLKLTFHTPMSRKAEDYGRKRQKEIDQKRAA